MKEFMMLFRHTLQEDYQPSHDEMAATIKMWQDWISDIAQQGNFVSTNQLSPVGKVIKADGFITDGPYAELKEILGGYIIVKARGIDQALDIARGCPVLHIGGNVEIRSFMDINL